MMNGYVQEIAELGYEVSDPYQGEGFAFVSVSGFGLHNYVRTDDEDSLKSIIETHNERVLQQGENVFQTILRHHEDPNDELELGDGELEIAHELAGRTE